MLFTIVQEVHLILKIHALSNTGAFSHVLSGLEYLLDFLNSLLLTHMCVSQPLENFRFQDLQLFCFFFTLMNYFSLFQDFLVLLSSFAFKSLDYELFFLNLFSLTHDLLLKPFFLSSPQILLFLLILYLFELSGLLLHLLGVFSLGIFENLHLDLQILIKLLLSKDLVSRPAQVFKLLILSFLCVLLLVDLVLEHLLGFGPGLFYPLESFLFLGLQESDSVVEFLHFSLLLRSQLPGMRNRLEHGGVVGPRRDGLHVAALQERSLLTLIVVCDLLLLLSECVHQLVLAVSGPVGISRKVHLKISGLLGDTVPWLHEFCGSDLLFSVSALASLFWVEAYHWLVVNAEELVAAVDDAGSN